MRCSGDTWCGNASQRDRVELHFSPQGQRSGDVYPQDLPRQHAIGKRTGRAKAPYSRQFNAFMSRVVGITNLSNRTKRKENKYAGHNDDKQIIVAAAGGCGEWTVAWG